VRPRFPVCIYAHTLGTNGPKLLVCLTLKADNMRIYSYSVRVCYRFCAKLSNNALCAPRLTPKSLDGTQSIYESLMTSLPRSYGLPGVSRPSHILRMWHGARNTPQSPQAGVAHGRRPYHSSSSRQRCAKSSTLPTPSKALTASSAKLPKHAAAF
jgi:hypothetical protein